MLDRPARYAAMVASLSQMSRHYVGRRPNHAEDSSSTLLFGFFMIVLLGAIPPIAHIVEGAL